jgi:thiol-disulfide isomerase/thioredoxin
MALPRLKQQHALLLVLALFLALSLWTANETLRVRAPAPTIFPSPTPAPTAQALPDVEGSSIGNRAPDFNLDSVRAPGVFLRLSDYRGRKPVVVNFWASWCAPCREEMPLLERYWRAANGSFEILAVNLQEARGPALAFLEELNVTFPALLDPDARVKRAYNVITQPVTFFLDRDGVIRDKKLGLLIETELQEKLAKITTPLEAPPAEERVLVTAGIKHLVPFDKITCGLGYCPEVCSGVACWRDRIPALDAPRFESVSQAAWLNDSDLVLGLVYKGEARAYPVRILNWHEIVNDNVSGDPLVVTFCPLCASGALFSGRVGNLTLTFGTSGALYNSDLVMYDRQTESLWPQIRGQAVVGNLTPARLTRLPLDTVTWKEWREAHPATKVLSRDTGFPRDYDRDPYADYARTSDLWFPIQYEDDRLPPKEIVFGLSLGTKGKAYREADLRNLTVINDEFAGLPVAVWRDPASGVTRAFDRLAANRTLAFEYRNGNFRDTNTLSTWSAEGLALSGELAGTQLSGVGADRAHWMDRAYWFAWAAFFPGTALYAG